MRVAGLTGGIASGKSAVTRLLRQKGFIVIDADEIAHGVLKQGRWGWKRVVAVFGNDILQANGEIDREMLGRIVFADHALRRKLNQATHLPVALEIARQVVWRWLTCTWLVVIDMPLLFETGTNRVTYPNVLVICGAQAQVERLMQRDQSSREDALARIASQMPEEIKLRRAHIVIDNSGTPAELVGQVDRVVAQLRRGATWRGALLSPLTAVSLIGLVVFAIVK